MNFRRILSKSSLRSSSSSGKSLNQSEEASKFKSEIELLKQTIDLLKVSVESRDAAIGTLAREKEKMYVELKSAQRTNRNLHQQLVDERVIHSKEKEFLINEIRRVSKKSDCKVDGPPNMPIEDQSKYSIYYDELKAKDQIIFNIGAKYLKIQTSKMLLRKKFDELQLQNKKSFEDIIILLTENRRNLDKLFDKLVKCSSVPPSSKKYLKLLKINGHLNYENTQLRLNFSSQKEHIENPLNNLSLYYNKLKPSLPILDEINYKSAPFNNVRHDYTLSKLNGLKCFRNFQSGSSFHGIQKSFSDSCILIS